MLITHCQIAHLTNPLGYDLGCLNVSYLIEEAEGDKQVAARVRVATDENMTAIIYDSGEREDISPLGFQLPLALLPRTRYFWQVEAVTDAGDRGLSAINWFETGKMEEVWQGRWLSCDSSEKRHPIFAGQIPLDQPVKSARLYITALGLYEAYLNGERIGDEYLTPYCNNYHQWLQVQTYDITAQIQNGGKLEVMLGNGWYKGRFCFVDYDRNLPGHYGNEWGLLAEVRMTYEDGTQAVYGTDESWTVRRGPIVDSNLYDGEIWDATLADTEPLPAKLYAGKVPPLHDRLSVPVRIQKELKPVEKIITPKGEQVLDIGQNQAGIFRLRVHETKGKEIKIRVGEILQEGCFYRENLRSALAEYTFISDGNEHVIVPHFTFYGYRYVCIEGIGNVNPEDFTALVLHSDLPEAGTLTTGHSLINKLMENVGWGMLGNFIDVPTDCPQRDERMGWTGDAQVFSATACFYRDCYAFYRKFLYDMETEQQERDGAVPVVIPRFQLDEPDSSAVWGDAACIMPWTLYRYYGDVSILEQCYDSMKMWVDYMTRTDGDNHAWRTHFHYGDWLGLDNPNPDEITLGGTDNAFIADVYHRQSAVLLARAARVLGRTDDVETYEALADRLLQEIRNEYFTPNGRLAVETQTAHVLALAYDLMPDRARTQEGLRRQFERSG
ncbi:MAG: family 78 glycoside hydrolase catalytic domain, partial [Clostridia bacterium]|nr:family 78 glycoside hydrolase catalytic domain [Clostridia bacterium]